MKKKKILLGITGASGAVYAKKFIEAVSLLQEQIKEFSVILTENAYKVWEYELGYSFSEGGTFSVFDNKDFFSPPASGSAKYDVMVICPCSMGTMGRIAHGYANDLISRAADVMLKEHRKLIIVFREMPLNTVHIENMKILMQSGAIICPASPSFYSIPKNIDELINTVIEKILTLCDLEVKTFEWKKPFDD